MVGQALPHMVGVIFGPMNEGGHVLIVDRVVDDVAGTTRINHDSGNMSELLQLAGKAIVLKRTRLLFANRLEL